MSPDPVKTTGLPVLTAVGLAVGALVIGKVLGILMWVLIRKYLRVRRVQKPDLAPGAAHTRVQEPGTSIPELESLPYSQPPQSTACEMPNEFPASPPQLLSPDFRTEACITDWTKL
ncbi:hypothetical protein PG994_009832 [Apiospora phragmitis]|uniref:Uncharacterized protein n=1 Tax=Apiospora phragmitis TaxID=2905665 RepID=A0ABR1U769_9PEZI